MLHLWYVEFSPVCMLVVANVEKACSLTNEGIITIPTFRGTLWHGDRLRPALQGPYSLHPTVRSHSK